jgi:hypothetical protein
MKAPLVSFNAYVPSAGFRWIYRDELDKWRLCEPPDEWLPADHHFASVIDRYVPLLQPGITNVDVEPTAQPGISNRFFIAASRDECLLERRDVPAAGKRVDIPELYLRFASEQPTPGRILDYANQFGLLQYNESNLRIEREDAIGFESAFGWRLTDPESKYLHLQAEPASKWLREFSLARIRLEHWSQLKTGGDPRGMRLFLAGDENLVGAKILLLPNLDTSTLTVRSELIAPSLADMIRAQFVLSVSSGVVHRQCAECPTWFAVYPGSGRPEKEFCSNACRMRAYRRRQRRTISAEGR